METYRYPRLRAGWRAPCTGRNCWWSNLASWVYLSLTILSRILFGQIFGAAINSKHVWGAAWSIQKFSRTVSYMCSCSWYFWRGQTKFAVLSEMYRAFTWIPSQVSRDFGRSCLASTEVSRQKGKYNGVQVHHVVWRRCLRYLELILFTKIDEGTCTYKGSQASGFLI